MLHTNNKILSGFKPIIILLIVAAAFGVSIGGAYAAFTDKGKIAGSSFTMGSANVKFLTDLAATPTEYNTTDEMAGPSFTNVHPNWQQDYAIKLYNTSESPVQISTNSNYATINDPDDLRTIIYADIYGWDDVNTNGIAEENEISTTSQGKRTISNWKSNEMDLGRVEGGQVKGYVIRFSTESVSDTKQGKSGVFDFEFSATGL